jgi:hypothetical protein
MRKVVRVGMAVAALAVLAACSPKGPQPKTLLLNGFERVPDSALLKRQFDPVEALKKPTYPSHDFDVATSGYATLSAVHKEAARQAKDKPLYKFIQGRYAAKVRFSVPSDYKVKGSDRYPKIWESGFSMTIASRTPLPATDWSAYKYLSLRVFNPGPRLQTLWVRISDSASVVTQTAAVVPLGESELEFPLGFLSDARLNSRDIKALTFYLDTAAQDVDPYLYFDEIALQDMDAALRAKLAAEEGVEEEEQEDWDEEEGDSIRKVRVVRPGETPAAAETVGGPVSAP